MELLKKALGTHPELAPQLLMVHGHGKYDYRGIMPCTFHFPIDSCIAPQWLWRQGLVLCMYRSTLHQLLFHVIRMSCVGAPEWMVGATCF